MPLEVTHHNKRRHDNVKLCIKRRFTIINENLSFNRVCHHIDQFLESMKSQLSSTSENDTSQSLSLDRYVEAGAINVQGSASDAHRQKLDATQ